VVLAGAEVGGIHQILNGVDRETVSRRRKAMSTIHTRGGALRTRLRILAVKLFLLSFASLRGRHDPR
jgi:hypothetical protein